MTGGEGGGVDLCIIVTWVEIVSRQTALAGYTPDCQLNYQKNSIRSVLFHVNPLCPDTPGCSLGILQLMPASPAPI